MSTEPIPRLPDPTPLGVVPADRRESRDPAFIAASWTPACAGAGREMDELERMSEGAAGGAVHV